jgi:hypothetical protein
MNPEETLSEAQLAALAKVVDELGERAASVRLGVGIDSLLRVLARRPNVRRGTIALLQRSLGQLEQKAGA